MTITCLLYCFVLSSHANAFTVVFAPSAVWQRIVSPRNSRRQKEIAAVNAAEDKSLEAKNCRQIILRIFVLIMFHFSIRIFFKYEHMITILLICSLLDIK